MRLRPIPVRLALAWFAAACGVPLLAQPSGGPYGPVQQRYEVPQANHVYFVAPDGKPEATGSSVSQPTTIETAIARVVTGDAIILRGGVYRTGDLRLSQGVTIQPYADERPVLKGTEVATQWEELPDGKWRTHWTKLFPAAPADWWRPGWGGRKTPLYLFNNDMVFIDGELLGAVGSEQDVTAKTYFVDYPNGQITIGANPAGHIIEITAHDSALVRTFRKTHGKENDHRGPVIRGITFTQYAYRALEVEGVEPQKHADPATFGKEVVGTVLDNDTISYCSRVAGYFRGDKLVIRNCLVSHCGTEGIYVINSGDILLERNIVTQTNTDESFSGYYASAVKIFNQSYRAVVRDNLVIDNPNSTGVWFDVGEVDALFVNNWVQNTNEGFFFEISKGATCAGNVFVKCAQGTRVLNSSNVRIYQNTYYDCGAAIGRNERSAVNDHFGWHPSAGPDLDQRHGHVFVDNLVVVDDQFTGPLLQVWQSDLLRGKLEDQQLAELDGNVYVRRQGVKPSALIAWSPVDNASGSADFATIADFRKLHPEFEQHSRFLPDYWGPLFQSAELGRLELLPRFPLRRGGIALPDSVRALLHETRSAAFPGAYPPR